MKHISFGLFAAAAIASVALHGSHAPALAEEKTVIRSIPIGNLRVLDPIWTTAYITRNHAYMVWDTLFALDADNKPQPQMVDTWEVSPDKLTYSFKLREGLKWHHGPPVTAKDCVASIRRWAAKDGMGRTLLDFATSLEATDDKSFTLVLKQPVGFVIEALAKIDSNVPFMMPERLARTDPNEQIKEVIGSGPFRFVASEWVPGSKVIYEKFNDYVPRKESAEPGGGRQGRQVRPRGIGLHAGRGSRHGGDSKRRDRSARNRRRRISSPSSRRTRTLSSSRTIRSATACSWCSTISIRLSTKRRCARRCFGASSRRISWRPSWVTPSVTKAAQPFSVAEIRTKSSAGAEPLMYPNVAKAKKMIADAGAAGARILLLDPADNSTLHPAALMGAQALRAIGFDVNVQAMDWSTVTQRRASKAKPADGGWNVFITNTTVTGISNPLVHNFVKNCEQAWYGWPCDPESSSKHGPGGSRLTRPSAN